MTAVQIVSFCENGTKLRLHRDRVKRIFLNEDVRKLPLSVISIAGVFGSGKSFRLSLILRYLSKNRSASWLQDDVNEPISGFPFQSSKETTTIGVWVWSELFIVTTNSNEKIAIVLVDTQGSYDSKQTFDIMSKLFSFSTSMSSVLIYNCLDGLLENKLGDLQLFTAYGRVAAEHGVDEPLQKITFLIRDWPNDNPEYPHGCAGGCAYVNHYFIEDLNNDEGIELRRKLRCTFECLTGCLMPYPGSAAKFDFDGKLENISVSFKECMGEFVRSILDDENIVKKAINGQPLICEQMINYIQTHFDYISKEMEGVDALVFANVKFSNMAAINKAKEVYKNEINIATDNKNKYLEEKELKKVHKNACIKARETFCAIPTLQYGANNDKKHYVKMLNEELEKLYQINKAENFMLNVPSNEQNRDQMVPVGAGIITTGYGLYTSQATLQSLVMSAGGLSLVVLGLVGFIYRVVKYFNPNITILGIVNQILEPVYSRAQQYLNFFIPDTAPAAPNPMPTTFPANQFQNLQNQQQVAANKRRSRVKTIVNYILLSIVLYFCFMLFSPSFNSFIRPTTNIGSIIFSCLIGIFMVIVCNYWLNHT